jgi:hypothetical protein
MFLMFFLLPLFILWTVAWGVRRVIDEVIVPFKATFDVVLGILSMSFRKAAGSKGVQQRVA